ncbi:MULTISPECIES: phosphonate ABC transporter ATP-binding protein [Halomonadaceae]|uniref:ATP-binding cassette domain-containing protein n=1 Tax=Vreelandella halophila TaxID=86177 RepID=A0A9X5B4M7_9GAMM|nr:MULTISPECIES: ATP-binding cassette domain-containing protein [Halomonas]MYL25242.1 ATP-binding cassette domain-containing protein [Halomonas utahensis]MYL75304.1 ATP-binding cassette domain-containing protein [Halomonas sp. 22501_18_FS]
MAILAVNDLSASYGGERVLGPLSLSLASGERVALVGRSGAGKSTLLSLLYDEAESGTAYMPQDLGLVDTLSVFHNVYMGQLDRHTTLYSLCNLLFPLKKPRGEVQGILDRLGLGDKLREPAGELSGGQRQRVAVARALYQQGSLLLADEPVSALDGPLARRVMAALTEAYPTSVIALHDVELALAFSDRIIGIQDGHIALDEPSARLTAADLQPLY